jgi:hypothetical protein
MESLETKNRIVLYNGPTATIVTDNAVPFPLHSQVQANEVSTSSNVDTIQDDCVFSNLPSCSFGCKERVLRNFDLVFDAALLELHLAPYDLRGVAAIQKTRVGEQRSMFELFYQVQ